MIIMEGVDDTPAKDNADKSPDKVQDENVPINDNEDFHNNSKESNNDPINKACVEKSSDTASNPTDDTSNKMETNADEDLEEGEISDDEEDEEPPKESVTTNLDNGKHKSMPESNEHSDHSDANVNRIRTDEESEPSDSGKKNGNSDSHRSKDKKSRRDKRSDRDLKKELQDDEAKKREIKEKIRELERQMKMDDDGEDEEDLEEMGILGVGGSPRENRKQRKRKSESDCNDEVDQDRGERSRSRSPKRRKRERDDHRRRRGRDQEESKRGFGSGGFGSGFGRNAPRGDKSSELCKLFMQGKCPKSPQNCLYSHAAEPPKIMELCKFYLLERCAKREKCLYLHKGFPCKYFHTGMRCMDDAESCKFSHGDLTDVTRTILLKHLEAAPKEILGDFPRLTREKALELVYKTEAKNKGWETFDKSKDEPQPKSAGDSFVEQQNMSHPNKGNDNNRGFGPDDRNHGPIKSMAEDNSKKSRWEPENTQRDFEAPFMQNHPPPLMQPPPNYFRAPGPGPRGPASGPFGPRGPIGMGFGQRGPNPGLGLLGQAPGIGNHPQRAIGGNFSQHPFNQREQSQQGDKPLGMVPPGYGDPDFGEDQVKTFLKAQRQGQDNSSGSESYDNNSSVSKWGPPPSDWNGPNIPTGPNSFSSQPLKSSNIGDKQKTSHQSNSGNSPERERTPTPEDNMDFGDDSTGKPTEDKPVSQRKVYEELQRKHKEKEMRLETVKEPNPMFKEDNWYSSDEESEEKSEEKRKSPEKRASTDEYADHPNTQTSQHQNVKTTTLSLRETPATPPPPPILSASDRNSMEASSTANNRVALPKELTQVLSSIQTNPSSSTSFESNTSPSSGKRDPRSSRDPRQQSKNDPRLGKPSSQSGSDSLSETEREKEKEKRILEMDLSIFGDLDLPTFKDSEDNSAGNESPATEEENSLNLPFKPHKVHQVAKEIDASIYSHSPLEYRLRAIFIAKPDYSDMLIKQHIPASKVQQDPRLRRYSDKISGKISSASNIHSNDRRYSDDGIEIMSPPGPTKTKGDPRRNKGQHAQKLNEHTTNHHEEENVYNPMKDLHSARSQQPPQFPQHRQNDNYNQDIYSPTQDVQDMYSSKPKKQNNNSGQDNQESGGYNPRQDLNPNLRNSVNQGPPPGPTGPWSGGPGGHPYGPYDNFYGGNNQNDYSGNADSNFYSNHPNDYGGINNARGGFGGNVHGPGMMAGAPPRSGDPRTNRRDPRRKD